MAQTRLAKALETMVKITKSGPDQRALLEAARDRYLNVVYGKGMNLKEGEQRDMFWVAEAGLAAGELDEKLGLWDPAAELYDRLQRELPSMREKLKRRWSVARERAKN